MQDTEILETVQALVDEEHELRSRMESGSIAPDDEQRRLRQLEESLDQCWDLLRQRRALRDAGLNPDEAEVRGPGEVESYLQ